MQTVIKREPKANCVAIDGLNETKRAHCHQEKSANAAWPGAVGATSSGRTGRVRNCALDALAISLFLSLSLSFWPSCCPASLHAGDYPSLNRLHQHHRPPLTPPIVLGNFKITVLYYSFSLLLNLS